MARKPDPFRAALGRQLLETQRLLAESVRQSLRPAPSPLSSHIASAAAARQQVLGISDEIRRQVIEAGKQMKRQWEQELPSNWQELGAREVDRIIDVMGVTGINLVWVPRQELVLEAVDLREQATVEALLVDRAEDVLEDVEQAAAEATHSKVVSTSEAAREAIAAYSAGNHRAAQALAAATLTHLVQDLLGFKQLADVRRKYRDEDPDHVALRLFRVTAVLRAAARALFREDEALPGFNRNASLHYVRGDQYTPANALAALLLTVGLLRELHELSSRDGNGSAPA